jgi:hypothetical protein
MHKTPQLRIVTHKKTAPIRPTGAVKDAKPINLHKTTVTIPGQLFSVNSRKKSFSN